MGKSKRKSKVLGQRDILTQVNAGAVSKSKPKPKAPGHFPPAPGCSCKHETPQKIYQTVYIVTSINRDPDDPDEPTAYETSNVYPTLESANQAARYLASEYGFEPEICDEYEERFTDDGRLVIHVGGSAGFEENTLDIQVEERELEDSARVCVFLGEYQRYGGADQEAEVDTANTIGVFRSPENANEAARMYMKNRLVERPFGKKVAERSWEESSDTLGGITINAEDTLGRQHCCLVDRYTIRDQEE